MQQDNIAKDQPSQCKCFELIFIRRPSASQNTYHAADKIYDALDCPTNAQVFIQAARKMLPVLTNCDGY